MIRHQAIGPNFDALGNIGIINRNGMIRFSNHPERLDHPIALNCDGCDFDPSRSTTAISFFTQDEQGENVLRSIHPVLNRTPCKECHGPTEVNPVNGTLVVDYQAATIQQQARKTTLMLMGSGSVIVVVNLIGGWWFMRRFVLRPIAHLEETSHALAEGDLDARVKIDGDDELAQLGARFNRMAASLQASLREIKNKETFLQGLVDANPDGIRIIDDKYNVVLANKAYCEHIGIALEQAVGQPCYASHQRDKPCVPTLICCPLHEIKTDNESDLRIIILNLVQNAFHAISGQGILTVITKREAGQVYLLFEDTGIGIPIENLQRIFDPFFSHRADKVQGTGLGLAITQALVERYNGTISAENRQDPGSRFILSFPDPDIS